MGWARIEDLLLISMGAVLPQAFIIPPRKTVNNIINLDKLGKIALATKFKSTGNVGDIAGGEYGGRLEFDRRVRRFLDGRRPRIKPSRTKRGHLRLD